MLNPCVHVSAIGLEDEWLGGALGCSWTRSKAGVHVISCDRSSQSAYACLSFERASSAMSHCQTLNVASEKVLNNCTWRQPSNRAGLSPSTSLVSSGFWNNMHVLACAGPCWMQHGASMHPGGCAHSRLQHMRAGVSTLQAAPCLVLYASCTLLHSSSTSQGAHMSVALVSQEERALSAPAPSLGLRELRPGVPFALVEPAAC